MRFTTWVCDAPDCHVAHQESEWGAGHPGWGVLHGQVITDDATGRMLATDAILCPEHMAKVRVAVMEAK